MRRRWRPRHPAGKGGGAACAATRDTMPSGRGRLRCRPGRVILPDGPEERRRTSRRGRSASGVSGRDPLPTPAAPAQSGAKGKPPGAAWGQSPPGTDGVRPNRPAGAAPTGSSGEARPVSGFGPAGFVRAAAPAAQDPGRMAADPLRQMGLALHHAGHQADIGIEQAAILAMALIRREADHEGQFDHRPAPRGTDGVPPVRTAGSCRQSFMAISSVPWPQPSPRPGSAA